MKLRKMGALLLILCIVSTMLPIIAMAEESEITATEEPTIAMSEETENVAAEELVNALAEESEITYTTIAPNTWYTISGKNGEDCYYRYETDESGYGIYTLWIEGATEKNHHNATNGCPQFSLSDSSLIDLCIVPTSDEARFRLMKVEPASSLIITGVPATVLASIRENGENADFTGIEFEVTYRDGSKQPHTYNATYTWQTPWGATYIYYLDYDGNFYVPRYDESNHTLYINAFYIGDSAGLDSEGYIIPDESVDEPEEKVKISEGLSKVTGDLETTEFNTIEKIQNKLTETVVLNEGYTAENTVLYDIELVISNDGGLTWVPATAENFSKEGIEVTIPYPDGTNAEDYDFTVAHMFDEEVNGHKTGEVETPLVTKGANSISFRLMGTSPVIVGYKKVVEEHTHSYGEWMDCGDNANHQRTCSCGYVQKEAHVWDDGKITTEATKDAEGAKTYTCTTCGATKTESIAKLPSDTTSPKPEPATNSPSNTTTSPQTGDSTNLVLWVVLLIGSMIALWGTCFSRLKKKHQI